MKNLFSLSVGLGMLILCAAATNSFGADDERYGLRMTGYIGTKQLDSDIWLGDNQFAYGFELDYRPPGQPLSVVVGIRKSSGEGDLGVFHEEIDITEIMIGGRWNWDFKSGVMGDAPSHVYVGAGASLVDFESRGTAPGYSATIASDETSFFIGAGVYWDLPDNWTFNVDLTYTDSTAPFGGTDYDSSQLFIGVGLGYSF